MKIRITVDKSEALRAGKDRYGFAVVDVPAESLSAGEREFLIEWTTDREYRDSTYKGPEADYYLDRTRLENENGYSYDTTQPGAIAEATPEAVHRLIAMGVARYAALAEKKARAQAEELAKREAAIARVLAEPVEGWVEERYRTWEVKSGHYGIDDPRLSAKRAQAEAICAERNAARKAEREREAAEAKAAKERGESELREWAAVHGSALLRARIADGFEWVKLAQNEWAGAVVADLGDEADCPDGYDSDKNEERTTPTLGEIEALRAARKRLEGKPATVELRWLTYAPEVDEDAYPDDTAEPVKRTEVCVTVTAPTGSRHEFYYLPGSFAVAADETAGSPARQTN